ncbi:hypothetical protein F511_21150 [Dorcoceras hygrometricum]|uniref:Uncharacterized protein n=1 Tax=Dorcoceras hygrometricum TaxID=472368 RepID=A0A2Z7AFJ6_9LAMI|nr:hypothetical protein F511_21150 [Dorcoceras hygrometricum]
MGRDHMLARDPLFVPGSRHWSRLLSKSGSRPYVGSRPTLCYWVATLFRLCRQSLYLSMTVNGKVTMMKSRYLNGVQGKWVYLVTLTMSLFDLQDVCIAIGSLATLDLPMVVDLIGIYGLKGPYCMLTTINWFLQALSVIPRGSWGDVARRSYHDPMGMSGIMIPEPQWLWAHG